MTIEGEKVPIQPEVDEEVRRRAEIIALFMGDDYDMTVGVGPWGSGWHWDFIKNHVNMDAKDLATEKPDVVNGVASHEGNHRLGSRTESVMDLWPEPGFAYGFNAVEDPRANEIGMNFKPGSREWIQAYIERDLGPGGGLDYQGMEKETKGKLGYVPDYMKWGAEMIRYWYEKEFAGKIASKEEKDKFLANIPNKDVRDNVAKALDSFEKYYKTIPASKDEGEVRWKAAEAGQNFRDNMWPAYKKLVEKSYKDHSVVKMIEDMLSQDGKDGKPSFVVVPFSSLPKDVQDEIKKKMEEAQKGEGSGKGEESSSEKSGEGKPSTGQESKSKPSESGSANQPTEGQEDAGEASPSSKNTDTKSPKGKAGTGKVPWDKLSDRAKQEAGKAFGKLPEKDKDDYKKKAKEDLESAEDAANEKLRGKANDPKDNETHKEMTQRKANEGKEAEKEGKPGEESDDDKSEKENQPSAEDIAKAVKDMQTKFEKAVRKLPENPYHHYLHLPEVDAIRRRLERDLKRVFEPTESPDVRYTTTGLAPVMRKAMQMEADPRRTNIFESRGRPLEKSYRFFFLVDLSGSMSDKIEETFKALVPLVEVLNKLGIELAVGGYPISEKLVKIYKDFDTKKLTRETRDRIGEIMEELGGGTPTKEATMVSFANLKKRMAQNTIAHNYLITLTDGDPTSSSAEELLRYVNEIRKDRTVMMSGFGIGPGTEFTNRSYPALPGEVKAALARKLGKNVSEVQNSFKSATEFGQAFAIIIAYMIKRPELFFR